MVGMHRVGSAGNAARLKKEPRLTYVLRDSDDSNHCSAVNCLITYSSSAQVRGVNNVLFSGSRDGTLKRWDVINGKATCCATFESHNDWVNDAVLTGDTLVSCSSDSTIKTWRAFSDGVCTKTLRQHSDYVLSLAAAKHSNAVASAGLGGEIFVWDLEAADIPVVKAANKAADESSHEGNNGLARTAAQTATENGCSGCSDSTQAQGFTPVVVKGHKESVYALAMNDIGTVLVSGGTEKAVRVWDPRSGTKTMKLKGHTDNIRALILDDSGRYCLSGSSDSMIRLWDLGQQRCVHSYAVHTDSVWALASSPSFNRVYSGGRDFSVYSTDLTSRESLLVCSGQYPVLCLALESDDSLWVSTSESSVHKWPTKPKSEKDGASSFVAGTRPFARARACLESSPAVPLNTEPDCLIQVTPAIINHTVLNDRRHVLTKDTAGVVKLWEVTRGAVVADFGEVSFEDKEKDLFEMVSVPAWFTTDTRLGCLSVHLDTPQCFSAEMYGVDVHIPGASEELKINLGQETLRGLFSHWSACREKRAITPSLDNRELAAQRDTVNGSGRDFNSNGTLTTENSYSAASSPTFDFSKSYPSSIITEGSKGGTWRKKSSDLDGTEDEKDLPTWCLDCLVHGKCSSKENTKCSFYLHPYEGTTVQVLTQGKLTAPRILRIQKVITYVLEKMVLDKALDEGNTGSMANNSTQFHLVNGKVFKSGTRAWQVKTKFKVEILCNQQVLQPEMSLATVRQYVWKKPDDLYLYFRVTPEK